MNLRRDFDVFAHQGGEDLFGGGDVLELDLQEGAAFGIHGGLPELRRGHLAEALVALNLVFLAALLDDVVEDLARGLLFDGILRGLAAALAGLGFGGGAGGGGDDVVHAFLLLDLVGLVQSADWAVGVRAALGGVRDEERACSWFPSREQLAYLPSSWRDSAALASAQSMWRSAPCASVKLTDQVWCSSSKAGSPTRWNW